MQVGWWSLNVITNLRNLKSNYNTQSITKGIMFWERILDMLVSVPNYVNIYEDSITVSPAKLKRLWTYRAASLSWVSSTLRLAPRRRPLIYLPIPPSLKSMFPLWGDVPSSMGGWQGWCVIVIKIHTAWQSLTYTWDGIKCTEIFYRNHDILNCLLTYNYVILIAINTHTYVFVCMKLC